MACRRAIASRLAAALAWTLLSAAPGCDRDGEASAPPVDTSMPEPVIPTATAPEADAQTAPWMEALPTGEPSAEAGDRVWAAVPSAPTPAIADIGVFEVHGVFEGRYALTDRLGKRHERIPAALVHPVRDDGDLEEGDPVLFHTQTTPALIGRLAKLEAGAEISVRYDFGGATRTTTVDHAEPPRTGVEPMAYASFPKSGRRSRGLVLARNADRIWLRTASGHVEMHPKDEVRGLPLPDNLDVGTPVRAFRWATGYRPGVVDEVREPGLRYRIRLDEKGPARPYFFSALVPRG